MKFIEVAFLYRNAYQRELGGGLLKIATFVQLLERILPKGLRRSDLIGYLKGEISLEYGKKAHQYLETKKFPKSCFLFNGKVDTDLRKLQVKNFLYDGVI